MRFFRLFRLVTLRAKFVTAWALIQDPRVPLRIKLVALGLLVLIFSPLNVLGAIPLLGIVDDVALVSLLLGWFAKAAEPHTRVGAGSVLSV